MPTAVKNHQPLSWPVAVVATRLVLNHSVPRRQILVQWSGAAPEESTWEDFDHFQLQDPALQLEYKLTFKGGGNDTSPIMYMDPIYNLDSTMAQQQAQELAIEERTNGMEA